MQDIPNVFKDAARRPFIINDCSMDTRRTRVIFDSILIRLIPHYLELCGMFGGSLDMGLIPCVEMLIFRVEGLQKRDKSLQGYWYRQAQSAGFTWGAFKTLETEILRRIDFEIYKEGVDAEYEDGEHSLWVRYDVLELGTQ